ncbi:unnamed protein product, partial [Rangifer tarandus platyrhynchus]
MHYKGVHLLYQTCSCCNAIVIVFSPTADKSQIVSAACSCYSVIVILHQSHILGGAPHWRRPKQRSSSRRKWRRRKWRLRRYTRFETSGTRQHKPGNWR